METIYATIKTLDLKPIKIYNMKRRPFILVSLYEILDKQWPASTHLEYKKFRILFFMKPWYSLYNNKECFKSLGCLYLFFYLFT